MKKILSLTLLCCLISQIVFSQEHFKKGSNILTGGLNGNISNSENNDDDQNYTSKRRSSGLSANYGRFIKDNLVVGIGLAYSNINSINEYYYQDTLSHNNYERKSKNDYIGTNIFIRKYFPVNEKFGAYVRSSISYNRSNGNTTSSDSDQEYFHKGNYIGLSAGLGVYYFILNKVSLSLNMGDIGFGQTFGNSENNNNGTNNNSSNKSTGFSVSLVNQISFDQFFTINYHF